MQRADGNVLTKPDRTRPAVPKQDSVSLGQFLDKPALADPCSAHQTPDQVSAQRTDKLPDMRRQPRDLPLPGRQVITACTPTRPFPCALSCPIRHTSFKNPAETRRRTRQIEARDQDPHSFPTTSSQLPTPSGHVSRKSRSRRSLVREEIRTLECVVRGGVEPPTFRFQRVCRE